MSSPQPPACPSPRNPLQCPHVVSGTRFTNLMPRLRPWPSAIGQMYRRPAWLVDRFNIRISETAPVFARQSGDTTLAPMMVFGLIPAFMRDRPKKKLLHNVPARRPSRNFPSFRDAVQRRRCLIPANGFYESTSPAAKSAIPLSSC